MTIAAACAAAAVAAALPAASAAADPTPRVRLVYTRAPGAERCASEAAVRAGVAGRLGFEPFADDASRTIAVTVSPTGPGFTARLETRDQDASTGEREVTSEGRDCAELGAALELAIAIAVDPMSVTRPAAAAPGATAAAPPPPPAPSRLVVFREADRPRPAAAVALHVSAGAGILASAGSAPAVTGGAVIQGGLRRNALVLDVEGRADLPASLDVGAGRVTTSLLQVALVPCYRNGPLGACLLLGGGVLRAAGEGLADARHVSTLLVTVGGRVLWHLEIGRSTWIETRADLAAPLTRTTLRVDRVAVWSNPPVSGALGLIIGRDFR